MILSEGVPLKPLKSQPRSPCGLQTASHGCLLRYYVYIYTKHTHRTTHNKQIQNIHCSHESHNAQHAQMRYYTMYIVHVAQQEKCFESEFERHRKQ